MSFLDKLLGRTQPGAPAQPTAIDAAMPYVEIPAGQTPIVLASLELSVVVTGLFAETTRTMRFYNPNPRDLEGSLVFPLDDGAVVSGYALDVAGRMVDGVVVPKKEARRILEAELRKGVDPGLVEKVQGNVYRTRLYPIPARGSRTVRITTVSELTVRGNEAAHHLPLAWAAGVEQVHLHVEVVQAPVEPVMSGIGNLALRRWEERWVVEADLPKGAATADLQISLPALPDQFTAIERHDDGAFFCVSALAPELDRPRASWSPRRVALVWDASASREDTSRDLAALEALLTRWDSVTLDLIVLREVAEAAVAWTVEGGVSGPLLDHLRALPADGGTDLTALDLSAPPHPDDAGWLLFTDGMGTVRKGVPALGALPIFTLSSQANSDSGWLGHLANQTGGARFNLLRTGAADVADAIAHHVSPLRLVRALACRAVHTRLTQGRLTALGRLLEPSGRVELADADGKIIALDVRATDGPVGASLLARAWAGFEVARLELGGPDNAPQILALGRRYGLVTPGSSLLVLESLEQYLEYDLEPPATWPELREAWNARRDSARTARQRTEGDHIQEVVNLWQQRVTWWETDFRARWEAAKVAAAKFEMDERRPQDGSEGLRREAPSMAPPPPGAPPAPSPMAPPPSSARPAPSPMASQRMDSMEMERERGIAPMEAAADEMDDFGSVASMADLASEELAMEYERDEAPASPSRARRSMAPSPEPEPAAEGAGAPTHGAPAAMRIQKWTPDTPYLTAMKAAADPYAAYLAERRAFGASPAFYLDCGDWLLEAGQRAIGLRVLFNILERGLDDAALLRMVAWRLGQAGELDRAVELLERVLADRDDEPQSYRDLALMLGARWERDLADDDATRAMTLLSRVICKSWDRFPEIELIALMELNRLIHLTRPHDIDPPEGLDPRLIRLLDLDVRISMSWDADLTDVDLHVYEPNGEHAYYGNRNTALGGLVSRDFTRGYGPEEYVLREAHPGTYTIKAHYYGSTQQDLTGACTVIVTAFTHYGRPQEHKQVLTLRLDKPGQQVLVGEILIGTDPNDAYKPAWRKRFEGLTRGMTLDQITAIVGQPASISGGDPLVLIWHPTPEVGVYAITKPTLVSLIAVVHGEEVPLLDG